MSGVYMDFAPAWQEGKIVIVATLAEGPSAGCKVACVAVRGEILSGIRGARENLRRPGFLGNLRSAMKHYIAGGMAGRDVDAERNFMNDIAIMASLKAATGDESLLNESGLFSVLIAISEDAALPWHQRGLLEPGGITGMVQ